MCAVIRLGFPKRHVSPAAFVPEEAWRSFSEACFSFKQISISNSAVPTSKQTPETNTVGRLKWNNSDLTVKKGETALELFVLHYQNFAPRCFAYAISVNPATTYYKCPPQQYERCVSINNIRTRVCLHFALVLESLLCLKFPIVGDDIVMSQRYMFSKKL